MWRAKIPLVSINSPLGAVNVTSTKMMGMRTILRDASDKQKETGVLKSLWGTASNMNAIDGWQFMQVLTPMLPASLVQRVITNCDQEMEATYALGTPGLNGLHAYLAEIYNDDGAVYGGEHTRETINEEYVSNDDTKQRKKWHERTRRWCADNCSLAGIMSNNMASIGNPGMEQANQDRGMFDCMNRAHTEIQWTGTLPCHVNCKVASVWPFLNAEGVPWSEWCVRGDYDTVVLETISDVPENEDLLYDRNKTVLARLRASEINETSIIPMWLQNHINGLNDGNALLPRIDDMLFSRPDRVTFAEFFEEVFSIAKRGSASCTTYENFMFEKLACETRAKSLVGGYLAGTATTAPTELGPDASCRIEFNV